MPPILESLRLVLYLRLGDTLYNIAPSKTPKIILGGGDDTKAYICPKTCSIRSK